MCCKANGQTAFPSEDLDERQREITDYAILSYLRSDGALDIQVSFFGRYSSLYFTPGANVGDLLYDGIAQTAYKRDVAYGVQAEGAWHLGDSHTIRFGLLYQADDIAQRHLVAGAADRCRRSRQSQSQSALHRSRRRPARPRPRR